MRRLSLRRARRLALGAQGFGRRRVAGPGSGGDGSGRVDVRHLRRVVREMGLLQLDFVNVLVPSHYLVPFSRLGPYERERLDRMVYRDRELTEQWAHEACLVPMEDWPLLEHRRREWDPRPRSFGAFLGANPEYVAQALAEVRERGPLLPEALPEPDGGPQRVPHAWFGSVRRAVLEHHFGRGDVAIADRLPNFARVYDAVERIVPARHRELELDRPAQHQGLLLRAARAQGVATAGDLADYVRMPAVDAKAGVAALVAAGRLEEVRVEGWREVALLDPEATIPRRIEAAALLSPFDPVIWTRRRTARLFDFDYRFEIFIPEEKRRWGTYVLPFLQGDRLVARVDLKADRPNRRLQVRGAWLEPHAHPDRVLPALTPELTTLATWLGLGDVEVQDKGDLAAALEEAVRTA